jgi:hypothetical protein
MDSQELRRRLVSVRNAYAASGLPMATQAIRALLAVLDEMREAERHGDEASHDNLIYAIQSEMGIED